MALPETMSKTRYSQDVYDVGGRIREAREAAGLTQEQLAERAGISGNAISRYETAESEMRISTLFKIADGLGTSPDELMPERFTNESNSEIIGLLEKMDDDSRTAVIQIIKKLAAV